MTPYLAEITERRRRFHDHIAHRASLIPTSKENKTYSIPNTPFGIAKILPELPVRKIPVVNPEFYYHCMWFADLIAIPAPKPPGPPSVELIQRVVARKFGLSKIDLIADRRTKHVVLPRQIAVYLAKELTPRSLPEIGRRFGGRDHTTILYSVRKIAARCVSDPEFAGIIEALKAELRA